MIIETASVDANGLAERPTRAITLLQHRANCPGIARHALIEIKYRPVLASARNQNNEPGCAIAPDQSLRGHQE
jgi:hypothetical protein